MDTDMGNVSPGQPWTTEMVTTYTVEPFETSADNVYVWATRPGEGRDIKPMLRERNESRSPDGYTLAARAYFDAHPPRPAHPLADAKVGEWWLVDRGYGEHVVLSIIEGGDYADDHAVSARQVYVIPKDEADAVVDELVGDGCNRVAQIVRGVLDGAL